MKKILNIIVIMFSVNLVFSQNIEFTKSNFPDDKARLNRAIDNIYDGEDNFEDELYVKANEYFLKANEYNSNNAELNYKIGICYLHSSTKGKAEAFFSKAYSLNPNVSKDILFNLAYTSQLTSKFKRAKKQFIEYQEKLGDSKYDEKRKIIVKKHIEECENGIELMFNPTSGMVVGLNKINTEYSEYSPLINADESLMIFTSRRKGTIGGQKDPYDLLYYEDVYYSTNVDGWQEPDNFGAPVNSLLHEAAVGFSQDGQKLFLYKFDKANKGDLFFCVLNGTKWSKPERFPEPINTKFNETSAALSYDGRTLYFVSDREGGKGNKDIYVSVKSANGDWGTPKNIRSINTKYDEDAVFIHPNGKFLYFSSKGLGTMGGYDIFVSKLNKEGEWSEPKNLGYPINSPNDDIFFVLSADGERGYFTSSKTGGKGGKDIYMINFPEVEGVESEISLTVVKGVIKSQKLNTPIFANVEITNNSTGEVIATFTSNKNTGEFLFSLPAGEDYGINVNADNYLFYSENFSLNDNSKFEEVIMNINLSPINVGSKIVLRNIFFDYASDSLYDESYSEIDRVIKLMKESENIKLEISGHTDNVSSLLTNERLSLSRAKVVYAYMVSKGIAKRRLKYEGYAYHKPIASNDTEEGRKQNRRVEVKIIK